MYLRIGSKGDLVRKLQSTLEESGFNPGNIDGNFGPETRKAVVRFQGSKNLQEDGVVGPISLEALNIKATLDAPEYERKHFQALLLKNPNYFGNIKVSPFEPVKKITNNTFYEEIKCIGYNPHLEQLEAVVYIKKDYGYLGDICSSGTPEYVRFYVDWNNDGNWIDVGMTSFTAYDIPGDKPLEYDVTLKLSPKEKYCKVENLPEVRAILSWNKPPKPNDPEYQPIWGNVVEAQVQIDVLKIISIGELGKIAGLKLPTDMLETVDLSQPVSMLEPQELSIGELKESYQNKGIPAHRFAYSHMKKLMAKPTRAEKISMPGSSDVLEGLDIDISELIDKLLETDGNTHYEELKCIGFNPDASTLTGILTIKLPYGYSGDLCKKGSYEHVAFWEWDQIEQMWLYLGTTSVNVHDIKSITRSGLQYSVVLPVDFSHHQRPCTSGASVVRIRAVLSWQTLPSTTNPHEIPTWGNREETHIHIKPGHIPTGEPIAYIDGIGSMDVCAINQSNGLATGESAGTALFTAEESPFGGGITITGFIDSPPKYVMEGVEDPVKYKIFVRPYDPTKSDLENPWQSLNNTFKVSVNEQTGPGTLPKQKKITQAVDPDGYYTYLEDVHGSAWRMYAVANILAKWETSGLTGLWEVKIISKKPDGTILTGGALECPDGSTRSIVKLYLDNKLPFASITITGYKRGSSEVIEAADCGTFVVGDVIVGKYTATDVHFHELRLSVHPDPNPALPSPAKPKPDPMGPTAYPAIGGAVDHVWELDTKNMRACGYTVRLWTEDRTIVNGGYIGWERAAYVGFCLEEATEK